MRGLRIFLLVLAVLWGGGPVVQAQTGSDLARALRSNVVAIEAVWPDGQTKDGFGFLIGEQDGTAYIATALHVLRGDPGANPPELTVRFHGRPGQATTGDMFDLAADQLDLGVIAVAWPSDLEWEPNSFALDDQLPAFGEPVWFIGRDRDWYIPAREGAFNRESVADRRLYVDDLPVRAGTSGAPLLSSDGIIGMIIHDASPNEAIAVPISAIRAVSLEWGLPWGLEQDPPYEPGETFRECAECPEMVVVSAGSFLMGSPQDDEWRDDDEGPQHRVTIAEFFAIGVYEVTFNEWDACVADGGCNGYRPDDEDWGRGRRPVINVSWNDAQAYVDWLSNRTREDYRLPSEAEWEYAARAGTTTRYWPGDEITAEYAFFGSNVDRTIKVGSLERPNAFGLHDVHGNVWEWVEDCWNDSYAGAPANGTAWTSGNCDRRVLRGGSWIDDPWNLRSADRFWHERDGRVGAVGFRVARPLR
jgi:formylglycine-generating enzyme required for sulfatase activity